MDDEFIGIKKIFNNYEILRERLKVAGVYIDGKLEAFTIGELLNSNMAIDSYRKS